MTMIDKMESTFKVKFEGDLRGIRSVKKYKYTHENGHEIIGVVKVWTQENALSADRVRNWKSDYKNPNETAVKNAPIPTSKAGVREGVGMGLDF